MVEDVSNVIDFIRIITGKCEAKAAKKALSNMTLATLLKRSKKYVKNMCSHYTQKNHPSHASEGGFFVFKIVLSNTSLSLTQSNLLKLSCHALAGFLAFGAHCVHAQP